jgi:hypothetical protein
MSPVSLCWHNKTLLPANCLKSPVSQLATSHNISWGLVQDCGDGELSPPLSLGCIPPTIRRRSHQAPMGSLIWRDTPPPSESGWRPRMHNGTHWGAGTSEGRWALFIRLVRTQVQMQACPRRQKGSLITTQWDTLVTTFLWGETVSLRFREQYGSMVLYESIWKCELRCRLQSEWGIPSCSMSVYPSSNGRRWVEIRVKTLPWSVWLITLKGI